MFYILSTVFLILIRRHVSWNWRRFIFSRVLEVLLVFSETIFGDTQLQRFQKAQLNHRNKRWRPVLENISFLWKTLWGKKKKKKKKKKEERPVCLRRSQLWWQTSVSGRKIASIRLKSKNLISVCWVKAKDYSLQRANKSFICLN